MSGFFEFSTLEQNTIMGSENLYHHHHPLQLQQQQQQQQPLVYSSLPSSTTSTTSSPRLFTVQDWNPSSVVLGSTGDEFNRYMNEILPNSREYFWPKNLDLVASVKKSILEADDDHDHHTKPSEFRSYVHPILPEKVLLQFENSSTPPPPPPKGSLSDSFLKLMCDTNAGILNNGYIKDGQEQDVIIDLNQNLWMNNSFSDGGHNNMQQKLPQTQVVFAADHDLVPCPPSYMSSCSRSTADHHHHHHPDLFASSAASVVPFSKANLPLLKDKYIMKCRNFDDEPFAERISSGYSHVQQLSDSTSNSSNKTSTTFRKDVWRKNKHPKPSTTHASDHDEVAKKQRVNVPQSSSCPTLKVRKEKLGDRIAALHRMVSPFGKTDTASVLTEAIAYIQFLQDQIQRLSVTYLKSSCSSSCLTTRGGRLSMKEQKDEEERERQDLKSRGLCLVPLAFTSYVFSYNGSIC